ncbi:MAG: hypothetical protein EZS28_035062, partial [Streblomastix strix]
EPTSRRQWIVPPTQTNPQSQITPNPNQNQSSILNVDLMGIFTNQFSVLIEIQYQQNAGEAAQVQHAPRETFSTYGNVRRVAFSTDSIVSGQVGNHIHEHKVEKKGERIPVRSKAISTNTSVVAFKNQSEDLQRQQPGTCPLTVPTYGNSEQNKGGD